MANPRQPVIIFGSGGLAKEVIGYIASDGRYQVLFVVSSEDFNNQAYGRAFKVYRELSPDFTGYKAILAVADPHAKVAILEKNASNHLDWITYIHSSCHISPWAAIGKGCIFAPQSIVAGDAVVQNFVFFNTNATVGHDSCIEDYCTLFPNSEVCGDCHIGEGSLLGIGSYVLPGKKIGAYTKVSAGAVVRHNFESDYQVLQGNPAYVRGTK